MADTLWSAQSSRKIRKRIVVEGELVLQSPAHFGNGDTDDLVDMPLLVDESDRKTPLLPGASLAGALRSYLRSREMGYYAPMPERDDKDALIKERNSAAVKLFGSLRMDAGEQSPVIIDDARGRKANVEVRTGVSICPKTRTAIPGQLFNTQYWQAGTTFDLHIELVIRENDNEDELIKALATALNGLENDFEHDFENGGITLGARKRRGHGCVKVAGWRSRTFDLTDSQGLLAWIREGDKKLEGDPAPIKNVLEVDELIEDLRTIFHLQADFALEGSMLIREGAGGDDSGADDAHISTRASGSDKTPIIPGTSLAGALRGRALRIAKTLKLTDPQGMVDGLFGPKIEKDRIQAEDNIEPAASRLLVAENKISDPYERVQNRIKIDRFTGGAFQTALFSEQAVFAGQSAATRVNLTIQEPTDAQIGLVLLLLKDLWTGDLALGGGSSVGRGRLKGKSAILTYAQPGNPEEKWTITQQEAGLTIDGEKEHLERFVNALRGGTNG
jgi:CRISPR/Cas system CSM-associated protein Csm3 (group 7 of RAMP superfamily)